MLIFIAYYLHLDINAENKNLFYINYITHLIKFNLYMRFMFIFVLINLKRYA